MRALNMWVLTGLAAGTAGFVPGIALAVQTIDFETVPGGTPAPALHITNQYEADTGVVFSLAGGGSPVLAQEGGVDGVALAFYQGPSHLPDTPADPSADGGFFLTDDGQFAAPHDLVLTFDNPMSVVGGDILDIDHTDAWSIVAFDSNNAQLVSTTLDTLATGAGDGGNAHWTLDVPAGTISSIRLSYVGGGTAPGLAFDNFTFVSGPSAAPPTAVPVPMAFWPGAGVIVAMAGVRALRARPRAV
jgi:hypothetical protein